MTDDQDLRNNLDIDNDGGEDGDLLEMGPTEQTDQDDGPVHATITIRRRRSLVRVDKYLQARFPRFSRTSMQKLIKEGAVTVNDHTVKPSYEITPGDCIQLILPPPEVREIEAQDIPLEIIYEDECMLAVNKPKGMVVHPARGYRSGTLVNALAGHCRHLSFGDDPVRPGIVHRLDKDTTGVILAAKTDEAHWRLALQFERRRVHKEYRAIIEGEFDFESDRIDAPIGAHRLVRERYAVQPENGKPAVTVYEVVERFRGFSHMRLLPQTGRTHQLRVHMSHLRHPIVGDFVYGARHITVGELLGTDDATPAIDRFALHAHRIEFRHPISGKTMQLEAPLPKDINDLIETLKKRRDMMPPMKTSTKRR